MAITNNTRDGIMYAFTTDTLPTDVEPSSKCYEYDSGKSYIFDGTLWREVGTGVPR